MSNIFDEVSSKLPLSSSTSSSSSSSSSSSKNSSSSSKSPQKGSTVSTLPKVAIQSITQTSDKAGSIPKVSPKELKDILKYTPPEISIMIWGPPGLGKSEIIGSEAKAGNHELSDVRLLTTDPVEIKGIGVPDLENDRSRWLRPDFLLRSENSWLFLDELNAAPRMLQAAAYQLVVDRRIGMHDLPKGSRVIAAGNRESDEGVAYRMPSPLANRFMHFELTPNVEQWAQWALQNGVIPDIVAFVSCYPEYLHHMTKESSSGPWPSPRTWVHASHSLKNLFKTVSNPEILPVISQKVLTSSVGSAASKSFFHFTNSSQVLHTDEILAGKNVSPDFIRNDAHAFVLAAYLASKTETEAHYETSVKYLSVVMEEVSRTYKALVGDRFGS